MAPTNGEASFDFEYTPNAKGTYYLGVLDGNQNEIETGSIDFEETEVPAEMLQSWLSTQSAELYFFEQNERIKIA